MLGAGAASAGIAAAASDDRERDLFALGLSVEGLVVQQRDDLVFEEDGGASLLHDLVGLSGFRDDRQLESAGPFGAIRDTNSGAEQEKPIDWNKVLREMRAAGVRASGDELDEHDLQALWERADGPYAPLGPPATVVPLAERLAGERPDQTPELAPAEEEGGQLTFDLAA
jgi:hypothetical protein